jgi:PAS domain S-box-containing protein
MPTRESLAADRGEEHPEPPSRTGPTVLIVDDEPCFAATLSDILTARGYDTIVAATGREAEETICRTPVDLAIVDLKLPDRSGVDVLGFVKERFRLTEVIMLTGQASLDTAVRSLNLGAFGYLEKPYDIDRLFLLIEKALARRAARRAASRPGELARLLDASPVPAFAFYPESGLISLASSGFSRLLDAGGAGAARTSLSALFGDSRPGALADHLTRLRQDRRATTDIRLVLRPGSLSWFELSSFIVGTEPETALGILTDITSRHEAAIECHQDRQYFEAIFDNLAGGVAIIDSHFVIQRANPTFARFYRSSPRALAGRKCHEVIHRRPTPCQLHGETCPIANSLALGSPSRVQHRHLDADDCLHYQECTVAPMTDDSGTIVSFAAMYADFTEIKLAQEESEAKSRQLESLNAELTLQREQLAAQAGQLEKANVELTRLSAAKDDFVSMVSHELRTPLTAISEGINLISDGSLGPTNERQSKFLALAGRNCARLAELINDLLDLSKIEAGRMDFRPARLDLALLTSEVADTFRVLARDKGLALQVCLPDSPLHVHADERLVRRILVNLVNNALKFTDRGSISLTATVSDSSAVVSVKDTGIGIPETEHGRMFEKFHQVHHHDRGRPAGTGLGLALTRQMVEMNHGRIWFESREGAGTAFHFTVPLNEPETGVRCEQ